MKNDKINDMEPMEPKDHVEDKDENGQIQAENTSVNDGRNKIDAAKYWKTAKESSTAFVKKATAKSSETAKKLANTLKDKKDTSQALTKLKQKSQNTIKKVSTTVKDKKENSETLAKVTQKSKETFQKVSATVSEKKAAKDELKPEKVVLAPGQVRRYKLFFVSDMEEEAQYLHEMSKSGMHFIKKSGVQYVFETGEAENYYYHLGYYEKDKRDGDRYRENYKEAGWENIYHEEGEFNGVWNYFRVKADEGEPAPEIFCDRSSHIALYNRLLTSWRPLLAVIILCLLCMVVFLFVLNNKTGRIDSVFLIVCILISMVFILIFAIYARLYIKIKKKLDEMQS